MHEVYSQLNTLTIALGETEVQHDVTLINSGSAQVFETKTRIKLAPGEQVNIRVKGDKFNQALANNIQQMNGLLGYAALDYTAEPVNEGDEDGRAFINAELEGEELIYQGGVISLLSDDNTPGFAVSGPITVGQQVGFTMPIYQIHGVNPFYEIALLISEHSNPTLAYDGRNEESAKGAYILDWTDAGGQTGVSLNRPNEPFVYTKPGDELRVSATISTDQLDLSVFDPSDSSTDTSSFSRPDIHITPMYFHLIATLTGHAASLNPIQLTRFKTVLPEIN